MFCLLAYQLTHYICWVVYGNFFLVSKKSSMLWSPGSTGQVKEGNESVARTFTITFDFSLFVTYVHEVTPELFWKLHSSWLMLFCCPDFTFPEYQADAPQGPSFSPHIFTRPNSALRVSGCHSIKDVYMPHLGLKILPFPKYIKVGIKISAMSTAGGKNLDAWPNTIQQTWLSFSCHFSFLKLLVTTYKFSNPFSCSLDIIHRVFDTQMCTIYLCEHRQCFWSQHSSALYSTADGLARLSWQAFRC